MKYIIYILVLPFVLQACTQKNLPTKSNETLVTEEIMQNKESADLAKESYLQLQKQREND